MGPLVLGGVRTGGAINAFICASTDSSPFTLGNTEATSWSFCSLVLSDAARSSKLETDHRTTFNNRNNDRRKVMFVRFFHPHIAFVVRDAISRRLERIMCSKWSNVLVKNRSFYSLNVASALWREMSTVRMWWMCFWENRDVITMSSVYLRPSCHLCAK